MLKKIISNSLSNVGLFFIKIVLTLIMTPIFIKNLGNYNYGIWEITISILGYMGLLDLGLSPTIARFVSFYLAKKKQKRLQKIYITSFVILGTIGFFLSFFAFLYAFGFAKNIAQEAINEKTYIWFFILVAVQILFVFPSVVFSSFLEGMQLYKQKNNIIIINSIVSSLFIFFLIEPKNALILVMFFNTFGIIIKNIWYVYLLNKKNLFLTFKFKKYFSFVLGKMLFKFGLKSFFQGASNRVSSNATNIIIAMFLGASSIVYFSLSIGIARYFRLLFANITHAFMPFFTSLIAKKKTQEITKVYLQISKYIIALLFLILFLLITFGFDFLTLWVGEEYAKKSYLLMVILAVGAFISLGCPFATRYLVASDQHGVLAKLEPINASLTIIFCLLLIKKFSLLGVAFALVIPNSLIHIFYFIYANKNLGVNNLEFLKKCYLPNLFVLCLPIIFMFFKFQYIEIENSLDFIFWAFITVSVYIFVFFMLNKKDRHIIKKLIKI